MTDELEIEETEETEETGTGGIGGGIQTGDNQTTPAELNFDSEDTYNAFRATLPEELREKPFFKDTKSLKSLAEQAINAQSALGKKRLPVPQDDWQDADWQDFYTQLRPETVDGYKGREKVSVQMEGEDIKEYAFDEQTASKLKEVAHSMGLTPKQYSQLEEVYASQAVQGEGALGQQINAHVESLTNELRKDWGNDFATNHRAANEAYQALVSQVPELEALMNWSPIVANHPAVMKLFHTLSPMVKDLGMPNSGNASGFGNDTVAGLEQQIADFDAENFDLMFVSESKMATLTPADKVKRQRLLDQRTQLYAKLYPTKGK